MLRIVWDWLRAGLPPQLVGFVRGPVGSAGVTSRGVNNCVRAGWLRRIDLTVTAEAFLPLRLILPRAGRNELRHAVDLSISQETPFDPNEVICQAVEIERSSESETFLVHVVPRRLIANAVKQLGPRSVGRIAIVGYEDVDLSPAVFPLRVLAPWLALLPILLLAIVLGTRAELALREQAQVMDTLESDASVALARLRALSDEFDALDASASGQRQVETALAGKISVLSLLERARRLISAQTEVTAVELRDGELRLSLRTNNVLAELAIFAASGWPGTVDGAITSDPATGQENATLRLPGVTS